MAYEFDLPDIGEGLAEATIVKWLVPVGGSVGLDEPMVEMETDKALVEIPAPRAGVVLHHGGPEGATIDVDSLLVVIGDPGEQWSPQAAPESSIPAQSAASAEAAPIVGTLDTSEGGPQALPAVRKLASDLGVDLDAVTGSGPGGRITRADVEAAASSVEDDSSDDVERVRLSATRLAIARNMTRSWQEIPHVVTYGDADASPLLEVRRSLAEKGRTIPLEAFLMKAVLAALDEFPQFNASLDGEYLKQWKRRDIGFAVDTPDGLMVAVVRDVAARNLDDIAADIMRLAEGAKTRALDAAEMRGATFTISNIGAVGGRYGTPLVPYGTTSILSVGRAGPEPVVIDGELAIGRRFPLSLAYDHRVIDGSTGRRFLQIVVDSLEQIAETRVDPESAG